MEQPDDALLVARSAGGDVTAFETLIERHQRVLFGVAMRMLGNYEDASDATQSAVKAYEKLSTFDPRFRFFSWIYRILLNECLNARRDRRPHEALTSHVAGGDGPIEALEAADRRHVVQRALLTLPPDYRKAGNHEGIAVFVDTWMAGGMGRAQGGYDEMVFRAMVRDEVPFYDPLGLVSEGTKIDFQVRGERLSLRHAVHDVAGAPPHAREADRMGLARRRQPRATTPRSSARCSAMSLEQAWAGMGRRRARVPADESRGRAQVSAHAAHAI